jgi:putative ABC transport system permease protein
MTRAVLFHRLILRPLRQEPVRTGLTWLAVALGVAVVLAMDLAGDAAAGSFRASMETLAGDADYEVTAAGGVPEGAVTALAAAPYPLRITTRLEDYAVLAGTGAVVPLIGVDFVASALEAEGGQDAFREPDAVLVSRDLGLRPGAKVRLIVQDEPREFVVRGLLAEGVSRTVVMDIAEAQRLLRRTGVVDRILIKVPGQQAADWAARLRALLPGSVQVAEFGARTEENRKMLAAFRWNLRVLSYIALVVGAFLIYNTVSVSVVRRRAEIGVLRALGATRGGVLAAFLGEAAFFGVAGGLVGLLLGRLLAEGAVGLVAQTVEALYVSSRPGAIALTPESALLALGIGVAVALASAFAPAREAARVTPLEAMARGRVEDLARVHQRRDLMLGLVLATMAAGAAQLGPVNGKPLFGYLAALLLIAAGALCVPMLVTALTGASARALRALFGVEALLAARSLAASLRRSSVLIGALATAVAMLTSVGIMVGSFRETVLQWMDAQLQADLYLRPAGMASADRHPTLAAAAADAIERLPGVAAVDRFRAYAIRYRGLPATLGAGDIGVMRRYSKTRFLAGEREAAYDALRAGGACVVSEPFANKHGVKVGDTLTLALGGADRAFRVAGIYADYANERGYVILDRATLLRYLPDPDPSNLAVYLEPGTDLETMRARVEQALGGRGVLVFSNRTLRTEAIRIFDRTFAITYALEAVAIVVAVFGIAGALLALVIDRRRELGLLRFLGAAAGQIRRLILFEAGLIGLLANAAGLVLGAALSLILVFVINRQSFGWTIQFHWPVAALVGGLTIVYAATVFAGLYPARVAVGLNPIEVVHEE